MRPIAVAGAGLLLIASIGLSAGCSQHPRELSCATTIVPTALPTWARAGFSPGDQPTKFVLGVKDLILGVVFGDPLRAPNVAGHGNKILWVANPVDTGKHPSSDPDLRIHATLNGTDATADRVIVGGPGPSLVDMPKPGCWTFTLNWSGRTDRMALLYR